VSNQTADNAVWTEQIQVKPLTVDINPGVGGKVNLLSGGAWSGGNIALGDLVSNNSFSGKIVNIAAQNSMTAKVGTSSVAIDPYNGVKIAGGGSYGSQLQITPESSGNGGALYLWSGGSVTDGGKAGNAALEAGSSSKGQGGNVLVSSGFSGGEGLEGGSLKLASAWGETKGGSIEIIAGDGLRQDSTSIGGSITITSGSCPYQGGVTGQVLIKTPDATTPVTTFDQSTRYTGDITIRTGNVLDPDNVGSGLGLAGLISLIPGENLRSDFGDKTGQVPLWLRSRSGYVDVQGAIRVNGYMYLADAINHGGTVGINPSIRLPPDTASLAADESDQGNLGDVRINTRGLYCKVRDGAVGEVGTWGFIPWQTLPAKLLIAQDKMGDTEVVSPPPALPPPEILSVSPDSIPRKSGEVRVMVTGSGFTPMSKVVAYGIYDVVVCGPDSIRFCLDSDLALSENEGLEFEIVNHDGQATKGRLVFA
jgi:hypothetical protein